MREYPEGRIIELEDDEIFVFGSNESGIHGKGAARDAHKLMGAQWGMGFGQYGNTFAIPTKDWNIKQLPLHIIEFYVNRFLDYTESKSNLVFLVTPIGCGYAGYKPELIAPMFQRHKNNVVLCPEFKTVLDNIKKVRESYTWDWRKKYE